MAEIGVEDLNVRGINLREARKSRPPKGQQLERWPRLEDAGGPKRIVWRQMVVNSNDSLIVLGGTAVVEIVEIVRWPILGLLALRWHRNVFLKHRSDRIPTGRRNVHACKSGACIPGRSGIATGHGERQRVAGKAVERAASRRLGVCYASDPVGVSAEVPGPLSRPEYRCLRGGCYTAFEALVCHESEKLVFEAGPPSVPP